MADEHFHDDIADRILAMDDTPSSIIHVVDWKIDVLVRGGDSTERYRLERLLGSKKDNPEKMKSLYAELTVIAARHPETGDRIFRSSHRDALLAKSGRACSQIAREYLKLTGFLEEEIKEAEKNLEPVDDFFGFESPTNLE